MTFMTQKEFADKIGVSKQYVGKLVKAGKVKLTPDKKIDYESAVDALKNTADPARAPEKNDSYTEARTHREIIKSKSEDMKFRRMAGELVEVNAIQSEFQSVWRDCRDRLMGLPANCKGRLVSMTDEREIQIYLSEQISGILEEIATRAVERIEYVRASS